MGKPKSVACQPESRRLISATVVTWRFTTSQGGPAIGCFRYLLVIALLVALVFMGGQGTPVASATHAGVSSTANAADKDCSDFSSQLRAQRFYSRNRPNRDPHDLDHDNDGIACEALRCPCLSGNGLTNGEWAIETVDGSGIPEPPFKTLIDGVAIDETRLLAFASRTDGRRFPQVLVIASSGYLRLKSGADPEPPLPFGQSLVLGPAVFGTSRSFESSTLFFNPQIQRVIIDTDRLRRSGKGQLLVNVVARDRNLAAASTKTNQIMDLAWRIVLDEPRAAKTRIGVKEEFDFTERVRPDATRTAEFQSFRLVQISSMFIDGARHDVDAMRYRAAGGPVELFYDPGQAGTLLPASPSSLASNRRLFDSVHTDDFGEPNGNSPSYRITIRRTTGPTSGPLTPRAFFVGSDDVNDDNLGLWIHRQPSQVIKRGVAGTISYTVEATADPLNAP